MISALALALTLKFDQSPDPRATGYNLLITKNGATVSQPIGASTPYCCKHGR